MNWEAIGAVAEAAGALGVLVSIVYLALQVKQNTEESRIARAQSLNTANADANALVANNPELSVIVRSGMIDFEALSESDKFRFSTIFFSFMTKYDFSYHQRKSGRLDEVFWKRTESEIRTFLTLPGSRHWWTRDRSRFSAEFADYVDRILAGSEVGSVVPTLGHVQ